jgi:hypothetical protein
MQNGRIRVSKKIQLFDFEKNLALLSMDSLPTPNHGGDDAKPCKGSARHQPDHEARVGRLGHIPILPQP